MTKIAVVCPRNMHFGPSAATSIDLCVRDFARFSKFRAGITVFGRPVANSFTDVDFHPVVCGGLVGHRRWARHLAQHLAAARPDLIEVQQHIPTASILARNLPDIPVIIIRHNFVKPRRGFLRRWRALRQMKPLSKLVFVSEATRNQFCRDFPELEAKAHFVHNGIDTTVWRPIDGERDKILLCVARMAPEKGVLEFAQAAAAILPRFPDWRAVVIAGDDATAHRGYAANVRATLAAIGDQVSILGPLPFEEVKSWTTRAEIVVVPSRYNEAYGRTAMEALAAGAALISSGTGGLREVSGDAALYIPSVGVEPLASAMERLIGDHTLRRRLQDDGRRRAETLLDIRIVAERLDEIRAAAADIRVRENQAA